jgi:hypothetical protein
MQVPIISNNMLTLYHYIIYFNKLKKKVEVKPNIKIDRDTVEISEKAMQLYLQSKKENGDGNKVN